MILRGLSRVILAATLLAPLWWRRPEKPAETLAPTATRPRDGASLWLEEPPLFVVGRPILFDATEYLIEATLIANAASAADPSASPPAADAGWPNHAYLRFNESVDPRRFRYKLDPAFGIEDRQLQLKGFMLRLRLNF